MDVAVRAMSLPVVVIVHVTQQPPAEATIFWDNAFSEAVSSVRVVDQYYAHECIRFLSCSRKDLLIDKLITRNLSCQCFYCSCPPQAFNRNVVKICLSCDQVVYLALSSGGRLKKLLRVAQAYPPQVIHTCTVHVNAQCIHVYGVMTIIL